jgi:predicted phosphoribosyltransferase
MQAVMSALLQDREQAGRLLSQKLDSYRNNAVVVGIPHGGVCVAFAIAEALSLSLEVLPCRRIKHPADSNKAIGSVSVSEAFIHDFSQCIPQDYIYHQIALLRNALQHEHHQYYRNRRPPSFLYKTVILVDDILEVSDTMLACLRDIKKQKPLKVIVAVPVVTAEAARIIRAEADEFVFLQMETSTRPAKDHFENFPRVDEREVRELLELSRKTVRLFE